MAEILKPDICVIGGGSGGLSVAAAAAVLGVPVVLIERHKMGGDCLNTGCVPSKALLAAAKRAELMRNAGVFGVSASAVDVDFAKVHDHVQRVIAAIAPVELGGAFQRAGRAGDQGPRQIQGPPHGRGRRRIRNPRAPLCHCDRIDGGAAADPGHRPGALSHQRYGVRSHRAARPPHHHRRRSDRARNGASLPPARQRGDGAGSGQHRSPRTTRNVRPSCSTSSNARALSSAAASR